MKKFRSITTINGKICNQFYRHILLYLKDPQIEKTSNKLDNYYRNTDPEINKKRSKLERDIKLSILSNGRFA